MGFLVTIIKIMLIWYALKYIIRLFFPIFIKKQIRKMEDQFRQQQGFQEKEEDINIGETVIDKKTKTKTSNDDVGEYIDYEDVD